MRGSIEGCVAGPTHKRTLRRFAELPHIPRSFIFITTSRHCGDTIPVRILRAQVALGHKLHTVIAVRDQRERLRTEARMRTLAFSDSLTGVANRGRFFDLLSIHTASRRERDQSFVVLMLDRHAPPDGRSLPTAAFRGGRRRRREGGGRREWARNRRLAPQSGSHRPHKSPSASRPHGSASHRR